MSINPANDPALLKLVTKAQTAAQDETPRGLVVEVARERHRRQAKQIVDAEMRGAIALDFLDEASLLAQPAATWLVHSLLPQSGLVQIVGEPGSYKTFAALDLSLSIAAGFKTWFGRRLNQHGAVVYVAAEGQGRFKYRVQVWKQLHSIQRPLPFYVLPSAVDLRHADLMQQFIARIQSWQPVLVVFDTLSRCIPGAEENSSKELGEAIAACDHIRRETGANVLLLHHPRKDGLSARGSGAGRGAVDTELWLKKTADKDLVELSVGKQKDGEDDLALTLKRRIIEISGVVEPDSGEPVTSCVLQVASEIDIEKSVKSLERRILEFVEAHPNTKTSAVAAGLKVNEKKVKDTIVALLFENRLVETPGTGKAHKGKFLTIA